MALQEVCGFYNSSLNLEWNASLLTALHQGSAVSVHEGDFISRWLQGSWNSNPLDFYVPVQEYLTDSPIEFGQIHPDLHSPWKDETANNNIDHSLPSFSMKSPIPLSVSPSVPLPFPLGHGTTTLGFVFQGGVIAAADSRSSCNGLVACPASQKILPVHSHLVGTTSGTSADCALWKRILSRELRLYQLRYKQRLSTGGAAKLLSHMLHPFKGTELCVAATLCGWDGEAKEIQLATHLETSGKTKYPEEKISFSITQPQAMSLTDCRPSTQTITGLTCKSGPKAANKTLLKRRSGPQLVYVCSDGLRLQGELFSVGSGSPYAYSVLDGKIHWGVSVDEAVSIAREAVYRATYRDAYSGNNVDLYHVTSEGWRRRKREDLKEEYYREKEKERKAVEQRHNKSN